MKELPKSLYAKLPTDFVSDCESYSAEELNKKILESNQALYDVEGEMEENEKLTAAKLIVKDLQEPYNAIKSQEKAKIKFCLYVLESRGQTTEE